MPAAPVVGAIVDFTPGISILINPFTLDSPQLGVLGTNVLGDQPADYVDISSVSYTHLRAHETDQYLVCRLLLEKNFFF